jgi:hypothetical protein
MAALPESSLVSLEEYLRTSYDPDMEFVDGVLVERNVGDWLHAPGSDQYSGRNPPEIPASESGCRTALKDRHYPVSHTGRFGFAGAA